MDIQAAIEAAVQRNIAQKIEMLTDTAFGTPQCLCESEETIRGWCDELDPLLTCQEMDAISDDDWQALHEGLNAPAVVKMVQDTMWAKCKAAREAAMAAMMAAMNG